MRSFAQFISVMVTKFGTEEGAPSNEGILSVFPPGASFGSARAEDHMSDQQAVENLEKSSMQASGAWSTVGES